MVLVAAGPSRSTLDQLTCAFFSCIVIPRVDLLVLFLYRCFGVGYTPFLRYVSFFCMKFQARSVGETFGYHLVPSFTTAMGRFDHVIFLLRFLWREVRFDVV